MAIDGLNPQQYNIQQQFGYNITPKQVSEYSKKPSSTSDDLFSRLNSLDGTFEKNRVNPYSTKTITPTTEATLIQPQEKEQAKGLSQRFASGELSETDAMDLLLNSGFDYIEEAKEELEQQAILDNANRNARGKMQNNNELNGYYDTYFQQVA